MVHHFDEDGAGGGAEAVGEEDNVFRVVELARCGGDGGARDVDAEGFVVIEGVRDVFALNSGEQVAVERVRAEELGPGGKVLVCFDINAASGDEVAGGQIIIDATIFGSLVLIKLSEGIADDVGERLGAEPATAKRII